MWDYERLCERLTRLTKKNQALPNRWRASLHVIGAATVPRPRGNTVHPRFSLWDYIRLSKRLSRLTKKNQAFIWKEEQEEAFTALKAALTSSPVLAYPDFNVPFCLQTNASGFRLCAVVTHCQIQNGQERVIAYASRVLSDAELNYWTTEQEGLTVVWVIMKFRYYLEGYYFTKYQMHFLVCVRNIQLSQISRVESG